MAATHLTGGLRRALVVLLAACALFLVFAGRALAGNGNGNGGGNGNGCDAPGNAYGHDNCDPPAPPPPPPPPPPPAPPPSSPAPPAPPSGSDPVPPASDPDLPSGDPSSTPDEPPAGDAPAPDGSTGSDDAASPAADPSADGGSSGGSTGAPSSDSSPGSSSAADAPAPSPGPPAAGWAPVETLPASPAPRATPHPTAPSARNFSSAPAPAATPDASWGDSHRATARDYGLVGNGAVVTLRRRHGVTGGLSFRVAMRRGASTFAFRASRSVTAGGGGRLYRIGAWLRSDVPGLTVCLRIQEMSPSDSLTPVRTSESCLAPTANWKHFRLFRRTLARGNKLVFSIYSYGGFEGDRFDIDRFTVARRVKLASKVGFKLGWKRVDAAFRPSES